MLWVDTIRAGTCRPLVCSCHLSQISLIQLPVMSLNTLIDARDLAICSFHIQFKASLRIGGYGYGYFWIAASSCALATPLATVDAVAQSANSDMA